MNLSHSHLRNGTRMNLQNSNVLLSVVCIFELCPVMKPLVSDCTKNVAYTQEEDTSSDFQDCLPLEMLERELKTKTQITPSAFQTRANLSHSQG